MHPNPHRRRTLIEQQLSLADANIVEIGALNGPTLSPKQYNIRFIDYADRKQLLKDTASNSAINPHDIVHVDYPVQDTKYSKFIQERFDLVIANHVIEHIPDIASWFLNIHGILDEGGLFFLSVPDKRYTFDYLRNETSIVDVVRAHSEAYVKPTVAMLFEYYYHRRPVGITECWNGQHLDIVARPGMSIEDALSNAVRAAEKYTSTHCHVFTADSFRLLLTEMKTLGYAPFDLVDFHDVDPGANEFHAMLRRS